MSAPDVPVVASTEELVLAGEFDTPTDGQWHAEVLKVFNRKRAPGTELTLDQSLAKMRMRTVEGIEIEGLYTNDHRDLGHPGVMPFVRGTTIRAGQMEAWDIRGFHEDPDPAISRKAVLTDLERGATSIWLRTGSDAIHPDDLSEVLADFLVDLAPIAVSSHEDQAAGARALVDFWADKGATTPSGTLGLDALSLRSRGVDSELASHHEWVRKCLADLPGVRALTVDALGYHEAGASDADELGLAIATGIEYVRDLEEQGISPDDAFGQIEFRVSAGADQFLTIARLRALRRLWARVGEVCGVPTHRRGAHQHAVSSWRMMTRDDPWVNMLRTTMACFAGSVGCAEAITVLPFDSVHGLPTDFSRRIARNTQLILSEESNTGRVNDPAGGSWYVESLTDALAHEGWQWLREIEAAGGMGEALNSTLIRDRLAKTCDERNERLAHRSMQLTGVSTFPNPAEPRLERTPRPPSPITGQGLPRRRDAEMFEELRDRSDRYLAATGHRPRVFLATIGLRRDYGARETFLSSLMGVAGIECPFVEGTDPAAMVEGFTQANTPVAVVCSSPKMYAQHGKAVAAALHAAGARMVYIAGKATELGEDADAVDGAIFAGIDVVSLLTAIQDQVLGETADRQEGEDR